MLRRRLARAQLLERLAHRVDDASAARCVRHRTPEACIGETEHRLALACVRVEIVCQYIDRDRSAIFRGGGHIGHCHRRGIVGGDHHRDRRRRLHTGRILNRVAERFCGRFTRRQIQERVAHCIDEVGTTWRQRDRALQTDRIERNDCLRIPSIGIRIVRQHIDRHRRGVLPDGDLVRHRCGCIVHTRDGHDQTR